MSLVAKRKAEAASSEDNTGKHIKLDPAVVAQGGDSITASDDASDDAGDFKRTEGKQ